MGKVRFVDLEINFADRELAMRVIEDWAERGTFPVQVVYGPEGCGKTAWLRESIELFRGRGGFDVIYVNPIDGFIRAELGGIADLRSRILSIAKDALTQEAWGGRVVWVIINIAREAIEARVSRLAIIVDDAFQVIGVDKAALYVKGLLGILEHPPAEYERVVTVVATSEGMSLREVGRHNWAEFKPMWNMSKEGFRQLYDQIPGSKPSLEETWRLTGGNPRMLEILYKARWNVDRVVEQLILEKAITKEFTTRWRRDLEATLNDPDHLWIEGGPGGELANELVERNLIVYGIPSRSPDLWIDQPPPERDSELGIGRYVAWQTPLHREAVKRVLRAT
ncbi:ATP-binding protein [Vulcanisaeta distributa]|uniref:ATP-binding protein n=1 Tax=Vulcanisaeta distributa TaxID=164451 RepID=UPI0006D272DB|nr:ATP-binding protein [Vulcanisaeta distributa]